MPENMEAPVDVPFMRSIKVQYGTLCVTCDKAILVGAPAWWSPDIGVWHFTCDRPIAKASEAKGTGGASNGATVEAGHTAPTQHAGSSATTTAQASHEPAEV